MWLFGHSVWAAVTCVSGASFGSLNVVVWAFCLGGMLSATCVSDVSFGSLNMVVWTFCLGCCDLCFGRFVWTAKKKTCVDVGVVGVRKCPRSVLS